MSTAPERKLTPREYLTIERAAEFRSEFFDGEMFAKQGGSWNHTLIKDNLAPEMSGQLGACPCHVLTSDLRVLISASGCYTYPDILIVCDKPQFEDDMRDTLLNPNVVIEVLSDSTERYDRGAKFDQYSELPSVREYILVAQDRPRVERFSRDVDGEWKLKVFKDLAGAFTFATLPATIPMAGIYAGVKFEES